MEILENCRGHGGNDQGHTLKLAILTSRCCSKKIRSVAACAATSSHFLAGGRTSWLLLADEVRPSNSVASVIVTGKSHVNSDRQSNCHTEKFTLKETFFHLTAENCLT